jgi:hypothetical protein
MFFDYDGRKSNSASESERIKERFQAVTIPNSAHQFFAGGLWASPHFRSSVSDSSADGSFDGSFGSGLFDSGYGSHISKSTRPLLDVSWKAEIGEWMEGREE